MIYFISDPKPLKKGKGKGKITPAVDPVERPVPEEITPSKGRLPLVTLNHVPFHVMFQ